jgi:hypothetical protein
LLADFKLELFTSASAPLIVLMHDLSDKRCFSCYRRLSDTSLHNDEDSGLQVEAVADEEAFIPEGKEDVDDEETFDEVEAVKQELRLMSVEELVSIFHRVEIACFNHLQGMRNEQDVHQHTKL